MLPCPLLCRNIGYIDKKLEGWEKGKKKAKWNALSKGSFTWLHLPRCFEPGVKRACNVQPPETPSRVHSVRAGEQGTLMNVFKWQNWDGVDASPRGLDVAQGFKACRRTDLVVSFLSRSNPAKLEGVFGGGREVIRIVFHRDWTSNGLFPLW